eukprot:217949_1
MSGCVSVTSARRTDSTIITTNSYGDPSKYHQQVTNTISLSNGRSRIDYEETTIRNLYNTNYNSELMNQPINIEYVNDIKTKWMDIKQQIKYDAIEAKKKRNEDTTASTIDNSIITKKWIITHYERENEVIVKPCHFKRDWLMIKDLQINESKNEKKVECTNQLTPILQPITKRPTTNAKCGDTSYIPLYIVSLSVIH